MLSSRTRRGLITDYVNVLLADVPLIQDISCTTGEGVDGLRATRRGVVSVVERQRVEETAERCHVSLLSSSGNARH